MRRGFDGGTCVRLPDRRWPVLLVLSDGWPHVGLELCLAEPGWADHDHRRHQHWRCCYMTGLITEALAMPATTSVPILGPVNGWNFWLAVMVLLTIPQTMINIRGARLVAALSDFSVVWHIAGGLIL